MNRDRSVTARELEASGLSYIETVEPGITRTRRGRGFSFQSANGTLIRDPEERERLLAIAVPPSYEHVVYCLDPDGHLQATGVDSKGNTQYFYHPEYEKLRDRKKFSRLSKFGEALPAFRRKVTRRLKNSDSEKEKVLCAIMRILDGTGMRIGSNSATHNNKTFGLTTLHKKHVSVDEDDIRFAYKGKGGGKITCELQDPLVSDLLNTCLHHSGSRLFEYENDEGQTQQIYSGDVNLFIQQHMGESFSAKDFRTWRFSCLFLEELTKRSEQEAVTLKEVLEMLSESTCNTPAILKSSYVHPGLLRACKEGSKGYRRKPQKPLPGLRKAENYLLRYLGSRHARRALRSEEIQKAAE